MTFCNCIISSGITTLFFIRLPLESFMSAHVVVNKEVSQFSAVVAPLVTDAFNPQNTHAVWARPPSQKFTLS